MLRNHPFSPLFRRLSLARRQSVIAQGVFLLAGTIAVGLPASADAYTDWLAGKLTPERTGPPLYSAEEDAALPGDSAFDYKYIDRNGILTPTLNGRFLLGVDYRYGANSAAQMQYDTRHFALSGINAYRAGTRSIEKEAGEPVSIAAWREKQQIMRQSGAANLLETGGQQHLMPIAEEVYKNVLQRPLPEAFTKWRTALHRTQPGMGSYYGDFFNAEYRHAHGEILAQVLKALGPQSTVASLYADEPRLSGSGPQTAAATRDWRAFLQRFYRDAAPDKDTNTDGATFNAAFQKNYASWEQVEQFSPQEYASRSDVQAIVDAWMRWGHARFIDTLSSEVQQVFPDGTVSEAYVETMREQISLLNAMPHNRFIGFGNYSNIAKTAYYTSLAHAYNKPGMTFHINQRSSGYDAVRNFAVGSLPFTAAQLWWTITTGVNDSQAADYGRNYGLANWWEVNSHIPKDWNGKVNRIVEYDPRFLIIPQIAPFMGRFDSMPREIANSVLWIEPPSEDLVRNNHAVSEEALVFGEQKLDLDRYKLVIFLKRGPAKFAETHQILSDYVERGGTVLVNLNEVGSGRTLFGQPNAPRWLASYKVGRAQTQAPLVIYSDQFSDPTRWKADLFAQEGPSPLVSPRSNRSIGAFPYGSSGSFTYKFRIPDAYPYFRIDDVHAVWAGENDVKMWISGDNQNWTLQHDDPINDSKPYEFSRIFDAKDVLTGSRDLYIKYFFKAGERDRNPADNRGASLRSFTLTALSADEVQRLEQDKTATTQIRSGDGQFSAQGLDSYLLPSAAAQTFGEITDSEKANRPLSFTTNQGRGRWIVWNAPSAIPYVTHTFPGANTKEWEAQWQLLNSVVQSQTQGRIENYNQPYILQNEDALMAVLWENSSAAKVQEIRFSSPHPRTVVYDVLDETTEGGAYIEAPNGQAQFNQDLSSAHLWVIKPYGTPILLAADGTVKYQLRIDNGSLKDKSLSFTMAEKATLSTPNRPLRALHNGKPVPVEYDAQTHIARIKGAGVLGTCSVEFE